MLWVNIIQQIGLLNVIEKSGYYGDKNSKVLDPACGSGTLFQN